MKPFIDRKSPNQQLSFNQLKVAFEKAELKENVMKRLLELLVDFDDNYTNLAYLVSDQNPYTIKYVRFDEDYSIIEQIEFEGSIFEQYADIYAYLEKYKKDYPSYIFREAIGNAIIHRDYSYLASTIIHLYTDHLEVTSIGGLIDGFKSEDVLNGISITRNKKLADIFRIMGLSEGFGMGIKRIQSVYKNYDKTIRIQCSYNAFKIIIPDIHTCKEVIDRRILTNKEKMILNLLESEGIVTDLQLQAKLDIKQSRSYLLTKQLSEKGYIEILGKGSTRRYKIKEED
ncbi:MAG: ATP-binding protein [Bacillota bacterium]|nr:ATP-binding protein [Bacillota bacterium]